MTNGGNDQTSIRRNGYDSFYPPYPQEVSASHTLPSYVLNVTPSGQIRIDHQHDTPHATTMPPIGKPTDFNTTVQTTIETLRDDILALVTNIIMLPEGNGEVKRFALPDGTESKVHVSGRQQQGNFVHETVRMTDEVAYQFTRLVGNRVPTLIQVPSGLSVVMVAASFELPANTVVKGQLHHPSSTDSLQFTTYDGTPLAINPTAVAADGSFETSIQLETAASYRLQYGEQELGVFLSPGDTLILTANASELNATYSFAGRAAQNSELAQHLLPSFQMQREWTGGPLAKVMKQKDAALFDQFSREQNLQVQQLLATYQGLASPETIDFYQKQWAHALAASKLWFLYTSNYKSHPDAPTPFSGFPKDFFADVDTLDISRDDAPPLFSTKLYTSLVHYRQARMGLPLYFGSDLLKAFPFLISTSSGKALYQTLHTFLFEAITSNNWHTNQRVKPYYDNFMKSCQDSSLTNSLKRQWRWSEQWQPGASAAELTLPLFDGSSLPLSRYKGKPVCLVIGEFFFSADLAAYAAFMKLEANQDVQFVVAQIRKSPDFPHQSLDSLFRGIPNVELLELRRHPKDARNVSTHTPTYSSKSFVLDARLRVVEGGLSPSYKYKSDIPKKYIRSISTIGPTSYPENLEELLDKARNARWFTEKQTAEFTKTAGWTALGVLLTALVIGAVSRQRMQTLKKREAMKRHIQELEIKAIRSQMNPHFVFNALNSIQSLITDNRQREATSYLAEFASLLRSVLNHSGKPLIPLSDELEAVDRYCRLEQLRFPFAYQIEVKGDIDPQLIEIPSMIIQPLVENAIVHGIAPHPEQAQLNVCIASDGGHLVVTVTDNGGGLAPPSSTRSKGNGIGLTLVEDRIRNFNNHEKNANLTVQNRMVDGHIAGVEATFTLLMD